MSPILEEIQGVRACRQGSSPEAAIGDLMSRAVADLNAKKDGVVRGIFHTKTQVDGALVELSQSFKASASEEEQVQHLQEMLETLKKLYGQLIAEMGKERGKRNKADIKATQALLDKLKSDLGQS